MQNKNKKVSFRHLGLIDYKEAWDLQTGFFQSVVNKKINNRENPDRPEATSNYLFFCQHPHVYTLGKSGKAAHLLASEAFLKNKQVSYYEINRGGDITYHGPGQIVAYPILDLDNFFTDIHKYMRFLEEAVIRTCKDFNVEAGRIPGLTGVWIDSENAAKARKIAAFGVKTSRWVTMHGLAFNINPDLGFFGNIIPCGITDKGVTSLAVEMGETPDIQAAEAALKKHLATVFEMEIIDF